MKKSYKEPITAEAFMQIHTNMLAGTTQGNMTDDEPDDGWDEGGANIKELQSDDDAVWNYEW